MTAARKISASEPRPDRSPEAVAARRAVRLEALADSALENCFPDPDAEPIHERWLTGDTDVDELIDELQAFLAVKHGLSAA